MALSSIGSAPSLQSGQQTAQSSGHHKHHGHKVMSVSDIEGQSSSALKSATGKLGSLLDKTV